MRIVIVCVLALFALFTQASDSTQTWQQWKKTWPLAKLNEKAIVQQPNDLIRSIELLDMRSDTSIIGLYTSKSQKPYAIQFQAGLKRLLVQNLANSSTGLPLLFVVKHFWINEDDTTLFFEKRTDPGAGKYSVTTVHNAHTKTLSTTKMKCAIDAFVKREDGYCTLIRIDTVLTDIRRVDQAAENVINMAINAISSKVTAGISVGYYKNRKPVSIETISDSYESVFNIPCLKTLELKKGVYFTWEQFKMNQPDNVDFIIQKNEKEPPTLYLQNESGKEIFTRNAFAVCDGKKVFKVQDGYVFELFSDKHSIYWMGIERLNASERSIPLLLPGPGMVGFGTESVGSKIKILLTPYLLNLETGHEY